MEHLPPGVKFHDSEFSDLPIVMPKTYKLLAACNEHHCPKVLEWFLDDPEWQFLVLETPSVTDLQTWFHRQMYDGVLLSWQLGGVEPAALVELLGQASPPSGIPVIWLAFSEPEPEAQSRLGTSPSHLLDAADCTPDTARQVIRQAIQTHQANQPAESPTPSPAA